MGEEYSRGGRHVGESAYDASAVTKQDHQRCELCGRLVPPELITLHHLTPKERGGKAEHRVPMCKPCHKQVHAVLGNKELARSYATIEQLRAAPQLQTFLVWIRKQRPDRVFRASMSNTRPRSKREKRR